MASGLIQPSYKAGYARSAHESVNPKFWNELAGAWIPELGNTGSTLYDVSGRGNHGTLQNQTSWNVSDGTHVLSYDGTNDYVDCGTGTRDSGFVLSLPWTMYARVKMVAGSVSNYYTAVQFTNSTTDLISIGVYNPRSWKIGTYGDTPGNGSSATAGDWYSVFLQWKASNTFEIYPNGKLNYSVSGGDASWQASDQLLIGKMSIASNQRDWNEPIGGVAVWQRLLTANEMLQLVRDPVAPFRRKRRIIVSAPAGSSFNPAWAINSNVLVM